MKFYNTWKRGDGYVTQEWSASEVFDFYFIKYIILGILLSFASAIISAIMLVIRLFGYDDDTKAPSYIGVGTSLYFLIDYANGWVISWVFKALNYATELKIMACWNLTFLLVHIFILVLGDTIYFNSDEAIRKRNLFIYTGFAIWILHTISKSFF